MNLSRAFAVLPASLRRHKVVVITLYLILLLVSMLGIQQVWRDDSLESWFGPDSEIFLNQREFEEHFGTTEDVYLVYEALDGDVFSEASLDALLRLHDALAGFAVKIQDDPDTELVHMREVLSLVNAPFTDVDGDTLALRPLLGRQQPGSEAGRIVLRERALSNPDVLYRFLSADARFGALAIKTDLGSVVADASDATASDFALDFSFDASESDGEGGDHASRRTVRDYEAYAEFMRAVRDLVSEANVDRQLKLHFTGLPEIIAFQVEVISAELGFIFLGLFVLMSLLLFVVFRHLSAVVWTLTVIVATVLLTLGVIGWSGIPTSDLTNAMALLIILISTADVVHIMAIYRLQRRKGDEHCAALAAAFGKAGVACFLTTFTTVAGFSSLWLVKPSIPVANFGLFTSIGLTFAFLVSITLLPILMDFWTLKCPTPRNPGKGITGAMDRVFALVLHHPKLVTLVFVISVAVAGVGAFRLSVDTNTLEALDKTTYIRQAFEAADRHMGGTQNIDFMLDLGATDALFDASVLRAMESIQADMRAEFPELIVTDSSVVNILKRINQQLHRDDPGEHRLPESDAEISQLLFLFNNISPEERRRLVAEDFDTGRITFGVRNAGSTTYVRLVEHAKNLSAQALSGLQGKYPDSSVVNAGGVVMFVSLFDSMSRAQVHSFLITLVIVTITLLFVFGSIKIGLLALAPNLVPVIVTFGTMGWLGISLNNVTMILAPIVLGIAVDDSVHFMSRLKQVLPSSDGIEHAVKTTLREVGPALCFTTLILAGGLSMLLYSSDANFQHFGFLGALALGTALLADLLLVPAICMLVMASHGRRVDLRPKILSLGESHD